MLFTSCTIYLCQFRHEESEKEGDKLICETENDDLNESFETEEKDSNFESFPFTSTPKKQELKCENCLDKHQCDTFFVDQYIQNRHKGDGSNFQE